MRKIVETYEGQWEEMLLKDISELINEGRDKESEMWAEQRHLISNVVQKMEG